MNVTTPLPIPLPNRVDAEDRRLILTGLAVIVATVGIFGVWAASAPLSGAVIVTGSVAVESERKTVQHLEGGIVKQILVAPGSIVHKGQPLIHLEEVQADAAVSALRAQLDADLARAARLSTERSFAPAVAFPPEVTRRADLPGVAQILETEGKLFQTRRRAVEDQIVILRAENQHITAEIASLENQYRSSDAGIESVREQIEIHERLRSENFVSHARLLDLKGQLAERELKRGEAGALLAQAQQKTKQNELKIEGLRQTYMREATDELRVAERRIDELRERLRPSEDALSRLTIAAPIAGEVVDLKVHTAGGVIAPREPLMDIVPAAAPLIIKGKVRTDDITHLRVGAEVAVQLTAYKRRTTPVVPGKLIYVSADMLTESTPAGPLSYYEVRISVDKAALREAGGLEIVPGMPIEAYVQTEERTLLEYLVQPLVQSMRRAMREY